MALSLKHEVKPEKGTLRVAVVDPAIAEMLADAWDKSQADPNYLGHVTGADDAKEIDDFFNHARTWAATHEPKLTVSKVARRALADTEALFTIAPFNPDAPRRGRKPGTQNKVKPAPAEKAAKK